MPTQDFSQDFLAKAGKRGHLHLLDKIPHGDPKIGSLIAEYGKANNSNHQSRNWVRAAKWIENIMFGLGRHYIDDLLMNRIARNSSTEELSVAKGKLRNVPQPTNDILGRYLEANIALFTENRPIPRITPKSDSLVDKRGAELSELTVEYLWEELDLLEKHREIKRLNLYTGTTWLEVCYDPLQPRYIQVPETREEATTPVAPGITAPIPREVPVIDPTTGEWKLREELEYGDITAKIISGFEMHTPVCHEWNGENMGWVMRESYTSIDDLRDKYTNPKLSRIVTKRNGYFKENIDEIEPENIQELPLWWWERISDSVEGPGPTLNIGTPEQWDDHTVVRIFDRKPNPLWPKGRTIITAGDKVIYDSPKNVGARAFDTRWPKRWHPYIRYRDEAQPGSIFGRSMVSKLLPKIKRINSIDTTMIMWRRTVPIAAWILPKGSQPVEGLFSGKPASLMKYDARATLGNEPKPVYPPSYPASAMQERELQFAEIEMIAGTEDILRGERPTGTTSAAMLDTLRKQALASRSAALQSWDESIQEVGTSLLQEVIKNIKKDERYKQRINVLAREKASSFTIDQFAATNLSDNVQVRVDTASQAMVSREAKQTRAIEVMQYSQGLMMLPTTLRAEIISDLGWPDSLSPQGADINRARALIQYLKSRRFDLVVPMPEDDPYVIHEMLVDETKSEAFIDLDNEVQKAFFILVDIYRQQIEMLEMAKLQFEQTLAMGPAPPGGQGGG